MDDPDEGPLRRWPTGATPDATQGEDPPEAEPASEGSGRDPRVTHLLRSPAYRRADHDSEFLQQDELRHARLQLEYLKPELALQRHGIKSTVVLFGSARVEDPRTTRLRLEAAKKALAEQPESRALQRRAQIARRLDALSCYNEVAREFAKLVSTRCASQGPDHELVIMTGGGPGIMAAGNRGASEAGAPSIGLNIHLPEEQDPNAYLTPELCFQFGYFGLRKLHFMMRAKALVAFPGGYGTLDEIFDALCLLQTERMDPIPVVLVGRSFWERAFDPQFLADQGVIADSDLALFTVVETAEEIWQVLAKHYDLDVECPPNPDAG